MSHASFLKSPSNRRLMPSVSPCKHTENMKPDDRTEAPCPFAYSVIGMACLYWLYDGEAGWIGDHLAKNAQGKVAILPP